MNKRQSETACVERGCRRDNRAECKRNYKSELNKWRKAKRLEDNYHLRA